MKKIIIFIALFAMPFITKAQTLTITNNTGCDFDLVTAYADDNCGTNYQYETGGPSGTSFLAPAGKTISITIGTAPGWSSPWSPSTPGWYMADVCDDCGGACTTVGDPCLSGPPSSSSITYSCGGGCGSVVVTWTVNGGGDATVTIN